MKKKRLLAWLMTLVMMFGLMPATALADTTTPTLTPAAKSNGDVTISKVAAPVAGKDDEWQITMTINPATNIDPQPLELVLVLDTSGSMNFCTLVNHKGQHESTHDCSTTMQGDRKKNWKESRLYKATEEAKNMLTSLETAKVDATISIVTFDEIGRANLTETKDYTTAKTTLTNIGDAITSGGTHVNDGLKVAYNILSDEPENAVKAVVLLGDGVFNGTDPVDGNNSIIDYYDVPGYATAIKGTTSYGATGLKNTTLYTIAFAAGTNAQAALARVASPNEAYVAGDAEALKSVFAKIASKIVPMVSDNMTSGSVSDVKVTGTPTVNGTAASNIVANNGEEIRWNSPDTIESTETVTLVYNVTLKDLQSLNVGANTVDLNGDAKLSYAVGGVKKDPLAFPRPQAVVTVGQLEENYYLDGVLQENLTVKHPKVIVNGTNTFAWNADDSKVIAVNDEAVYKESKQGDTVVNKTGSVTATGVSYVVNHYYTTTPEYIVTYQYAGDDVPQDAATLPDPATHKVGETVRVAATPAAVEGYTFEGWYNGQEKVADTFNMPNNDVTLTGTWTKNSHEVTYSYENNVPGAPKLPDEATVDYGETVKVAAVPSLTGYTFDGWKFDGETYKAGATFAMPDKDVAFTGKWTPLTKSDSSVSD